MTHAQILEQMLTFSMQQHAVKDDIIANLQKEIAELKKAAETTPAK